MASRQQHGDLNVSNVISREPTHLHLVDLQVRRTWSAESLFIEKGKVLLGSESLCSGRTEMSIDSPQDVRHDSPTLSESGQDRLGASSTECGSCTNIARIQKTIQRGIADQNRENRESQSALLHSIMTIATTHLYQQRSAVTCER